MLVSIESELIADYPTVNFTNSRLYNQKHTTRSRSKMKTPSRQRIQNKVEKQLSS